MNISAGANWNRKFYPENENDMFDKEILENLGYIFYEHHLLERRYPIYLISGHKEKSN